MVLSRSLRDADGPTLPSRFLLRVEALLGDDLDREHRETAIPTLLPHLDRLRPPAPEYPRPAPDPAPDKRHVPIKVTALDRLLGDPYQFYALAILDLKQLQPLAADPFSDPALRGTLVHAILEKWHKAKVAQPGLALAPFAANCFAEERVHPLFRALWLATIAPFPPSEPLHPNLNPYSKLCGRRSAHVRSSPTHRAVYPHWYTATTPNLLRYGKIVA
ncbi:MAG: hypothetical protein HC794_02205 [Nitrospiraceae bacterium]|nr:hypothetical protein [Nitrospiraceae bacterium]